jgi:two-component system OmpR family sensor kinase
VSVSSPRAIPIRWRVTAFYSMLLVLIIGVVGAYLLSALENALREEVDVTLRLRAAQIEGAVHAVTWERLLEGEVPASVLDPSLVEEFAAPGTHSQVVDRQGRVIFRSPMLVGGQLPVGDDVVAQALRGEEGFVTIPVAGERLRVFVHPYMEGGQPVGAILVGQSLHHQDATLRRMQQQVTAAALSAALVSLLGGWWLTGRALGPIAEVTRVARRIAATGQFAQRIQPPPVRDEIGELVATFNDMLDRIEHIHRRQREFLADASHELRGPLMVIRGNLDLLQLDLPEEERRQSAHEAAEEVARMARLVGDLLFLSEVDAQEAMAHEPVALDAVVARAIERARDLDADAHRLVLERNDPVVVLGDEGRLGQLVWNLIENALRYTPPNGTVTVRLRQEGTVAELMVADTGIGIPPEHQPRVFERFYRVDTARSRQQGGTGLGLAIVKQVAETHGGQVRLRSKPGEGSTFTVVLPVLQSR